MNTGIMPVSLSQPEMLALIENDPLKDKRIAKDDDWYFGDTKLITNTHLGKLQYGGPLHLINHYRNIEDPDIDEEEKEHQIWGRAFHCAILEPDAFHDRFFVLDDTAVCKEIGGAKPRATNKYKEWKEKLERENAGKTCLKGTDYYDIMAIKDRLYAIPIAKSLLEFTIREAIYEAELLGVRCKVKPDAVRPRMYGLELKSMKEPATPENFFSNFKKYFWNRQSAFYKDALGVEEYWFIACEKKAPYTIGLYKISEGSLEIGRELYQTELRKYRHHFIENKIVEEGFVYMEHI